MFYTAKIFFLTLGDFLWDIGKDILKTALKIFGVLLFIFALAVLCKLIHLSWTLGWEFLSLTILN